MVFPDQRLELIREGAGLTKYLAYAPVRLLHPMVEDGGGSLIPTEVTEFLCADAHIAIDVDQYSLTTNGPPSVRPSANNT